MDSIDKKLYDSDGFDYTDRLNNLKIKEINLSNAESKLDAYFLETSILVNMFEELKLNKNDDGANNDIYIYDEEKVNKIMEKISTLKRKISDEIKKDNKFKKTLLGIFNYLTLLEETLEVLKEMNIIIIWDNVGNIYK